MFLAEIAIPGSAYTASCLAVWLACKRVDYLLSQDRKKEVSDWLRSSAEWWKAAPIKAFAVSFTSLFGDRLILGAVLYSCVWSMVLFSIFYTNIRSPFFFMLYLDGAVGRGYLPGFGHAVIQHWIPGYVEYDPELLMVTPLIVPLTYLLVCNIIGSTLTVICCYFLFRTMLGEDHPENYVMTPLIILGLAAALSFLFVMFSYAMTLFYIGELSGHSVTALMRAVSGIYRDLIYHKEMRNYPWVAFQLIPIMSSVLTSFLMLLFMVSMMLLRATITVLRFCGIVIKHFEVGREPMQAIGWVMLSAFTPLFWILSSLSYIRRAVVH